jgi:F0F1-type ATP synthase beta subunit
MATAVYTVELIHEPSGTYMDFDVEIDLLDTGGKVLDVLDPWFYSVNGLLGDVSVVPSFSHIED